jgi:hypothetical protein
MSHADNPFLASGRLPSIQVHLWTVKDGGYRNKFMLHTINAITLAHYLYMQAPSSASDPNVMRRRDAYLYLGD